MYVSKHILFGLLLSIFLFFTFPAIGLMGFTVIFLSSFLIDIDHYWWYVHKKKDLSLKRAYNWFIENERKALKMLRSQRNEIYSGLCFLHGIEILTILFLIGFFVSKYFFFIFLGFSFHLLLDYVDETTYHDRIDKFSLINDFYKFKKLRYVGDN